MLTGMGENHSGDNALSDQVLASMTYALAIQMWPLDAICFPLLQDITNSQTFLSA